MLLIMICNSILVVAFLNFCSCYIFVVSNNCLNWLVHVSKWTKWLEGRKSKEWRRKKNRNSSLSRSGMDFSSVLKKIAIVDLHEISCKNLLCRFISLLITDGYLIPLATTPPPHPRLKKTKKKQNKARKTNKNFSTISF